MAADPEGRQPSNVRGRLSHDQANVVSRRTGRARDVDAALHQLGVAEDDAVRRRLHPDLADVLGARIKVREAIDKPM